MNRVRQFGQCLEGIEYVERPGAYVVLVNSRGQVAVIDVDGDIHLPGGGIELCESAMDAARRELLEEIGFEVPLGRPVGRANQYVYSSLAGRHFNKLCTYFLATAASDGCPARPAQHEVIWMSPAEACTRLVHESHAWAVQQMGMAKIDGIDPAGDDPASTGSRVVPVEVQEGLRAYTQAVEHMLGQGLLGIYLYGSVAAGCSNGRTSDVDVVAILRSPIGQQTKEDLLTIHRANPLPLDATYITQDEVNQDVYPTPLQCVIRPVKLFQVPNGLIDFPIVRNDIYVNGRCIVGPGVRDVVRPVPWPLLSSCLREMFAVARERFKNPVLMLCRIVCSLQTRGPCSKAQAAAWALEHFEPKWHPLVRQALDEYRSGAASDSVAPDESLAFEEYCRTVVRSGPAQPSCHAAGSEGLSTVWTQGPSFQLRRIRPVDGQAVLGVYRQCEDFLALGPEPHASPAMVWKDVEASGQEGGVFCGIYRPDGQMVGIVDFVPANFEGQPHVAFLSLLMISLPFRGQGIGREIVKRVEKEIRKDPRIQTIRSAVQVTNSRALRFWEANGYRVVGGPERRPDQTTVYHLQKDVAQ